MSRGYISGLLLAAALLSVAPGNASSAPDVTQPGYKPPADSDEAGLWLQAEQFEKGLQQSPLLVRDEALNAYLKKLVCEIAGPQCSSVRVFLVEDPEFNAACLPNGTMVVQTGLLLRVENEAQLAVVLGHELTHYLKRHSIAHYQSERSIEGKLKFLFLPLSGLVLLPKVIAYGWLASHDRDQEREADAGGFDAVVGLGYDPRQAAIIWSHVEEEESANPKRSSSSLFMANHPTPKERLATMTKRADELQGQSHANTLGAETFRAATRPFRGAWLEQEIDRGEFSESIALFQRLIKNDPGSGDLQFYLGEAYRRRNQKGDADLALTAYRSAIAGTNAPVAAHRSLGLVALKSGQKTVARDAFRQYLALVPDASDRATVEYYLKTMGE